MKICHVVAWFPNSRNPLEASWIQRHIEALSPHCDNSILHLQVIPSTRFSVIRKSEPGLLQRIVEIPVNSWKLAEMLTAMLLSFYLFTLRFCRQADLINFHIAYPTLVYWHWMKKFFRRPVVISEHWSAYRFHFGVTDKSKLKSVKRIFRQGIPVIAVSSSLLSDIRNFSGGDFKGYIVPNAVSSPFSYRPGERREKFFMASYWKSPKRPLVVLEAFKLFAEDHPHFELVIGGGGPHVDIMKRWVDDNDLAGRVSFVGTLTPEEMASHISSSQAFLHCSDYETFSVVCAEALCCGAPVVASNVGGTPEFVDGTNGVLVNENSAAAWLDALRCFVRRRQEFDSELISRKTIDRFSKEQVGRRYYQILCEVAGKEEKFQK